MHPLTGRQCYIKHLSPGKCEVVVDLIGWPAGIYLDELTIPGEHGTTRGSFVKD